MTKSTQISQSIENLCNTHFATTIGLFYTEITRRKCAIQSIFNGGGFEYFVDIGHTDDIFIIFRGFPSTLIDFSGDLFFYIFYKSNIMITKQVIQKGPGEFNTFIQIRITIIWCIPFQCSANQTIGHHA